MPKLHHIKFGDLRLVAEEPDAKGFYGVKPFDFDTYNRTFDSDEIDKTLDELLSRFFGYGERFEITDDFKADDAGRILIETSTGHVYVTDIRDWIRSNGPDPTCYVLIDEEHTQYRWVIADWLGSVSQG